MWPMLMERGWGRRRARRRWRAHKLVIGAHQIRLDRMLYSRQCDLASTHHRVQRVLQAILRPGPAISCGHRFLIEFEPPSSSEIRWST